MHFGDCQFLTLYLPALDGCSEEAPVYQDTTMDRTQEDVSHTDHWCLKHKHGLEMGTSRLLNVVCGFKQNHSACLARG